MSCQRKDFEFENCFVEQISTGCLAQFCYYIECDKNAIIIDPMRDLKTYLDLIESRGSKLKYIIETHFHADFLSGHYDLSQTTGAEIVFGSGAKADFAFKEVADGSEITISDNAKIEVIHTPGHTLESSCFVLAVKYQETWKSVAVFTGDTMFLGDTGRPDLATSSNITSKDLAGMLFDSIQILKKLNDDLLVFPGHGAGSACGKNIQAGTFCTIGGQKKSNFALNENLKKEEFIEIATAEIPTPPEYFFIDALMNRQKIENFDNFIKKSFVPIELEEFENFMMQKDIVVLDSRCTKIIYQGFIPGSITIGLDMTYAVWAATLIKPNTKIILVTELGKEEESISRLGRVSFTNILGYLKGGFEAWVSAQKPIWTLTNYKINERIKQLEEGNDFILDIRKLNELKSTGIVKNTKHIPLEQIEERAEELPKDKPIHLLCRTGARVTICGSILRKLGFTNELVLLEDGIEDLMKYDFKTLKYSPDILI